MAYSTVALADEIVPTAAPYGAQFLHEILTRTEAEGLADRLNFRPFTRGRGANAGHALRAEFAVGGFFTRGPRHRLEVFADPVGSALQVGWQLSTPMAGVVGAMVVSPRAREVNAWLSSLPRNERELSQIVRGFESTVYLPVLAQLVDAV